MRITPAYAGKRYNLSRHLLWTRDHPRVCGEKASAFSALVVKLGSPPRMRGKEEWCMTDTGVFRITPAYAGKRAVLLMCSCHSLGSPPHVRGKEADERSKGQAHGITPACAGKSKNTFIGQSPAEDHPRMCGEKLVRLAFICGIWGSPPHVRGKGGRDHSVILVNGITPACAGKSLETNPIHAPPWDHPRMCGEKS